MFKIIIEIYDQTDELNQEKEKKNRNIKNKNIRENNENA